MVRSYCGWIALELPFTPVKGLSTKKVKVKLKINRAMAASDVGWTSATKVSSESRKASSSASIEKRKVGGTIILEELRGIGGTDVEGMKDSFLQCNAIWIDAPCSARKNATVIYNSRRFKIQRRCISGYAYFRADLERLQAL